jgi:hypothetical protein
MSNQARRLPSLPPWDHWNAERLAREQDENLRAFERGFRMRAFSDDERMYPSFESCYAHGVVVGEVARRGWPVFMGVDLAGTKRPGNVIFIAALDPQTQKRYPLEVLTGAWSSPETAQQISMAASRHSNVRYIMVENNGYQQALIDWVKSSPADHSFWYKIESYTTTGTSKNNLLIGMPSLEVEFKNKAWVIPYDEFGGHYVTCHCGWCTWKSEVRDYPMSATTDTVMAMWFCREAIAKWGDTSATQGGLGLQGLNNR